VNAMPRPRIGRKAHRRRGPKAIRSMAAATGRKAAMNRSTAANGRPLTNAAATEFSLTEAGLDSHRRRGYSARTDAAPPRTDFRRLS